MGRLTVHIGLQLADVFLFLSLLPKNVTKYLEHILATYMYNVTINTTFAYNFAILR